MRIGLIGGTFNPVHIAHLRIAEEARELCALDRMIFIPAADPPHKPLTGGVPFKQRYEIVRLAISDNPGFELSDIECQRFGKSYSIDTITSIRAEYPDDELFFIIGSDSFLEIGLWHRYAEIFQACNLIVVERPGRPVSDPLAALPVAIQGQFRYNSIFNRLEHEAGITVQFITGCLLDVSSSEIRRLVAAGHSIKYLVPPEVEAYIKEQRIYSKCL
ncbi:MAG TPA: nicotinate-nucleotide adenylyltransferase [Desulfuromonadaceae bacterium]|jgi:nicotinate-nucleotide adenylyltransferase